MKNINSDQTIRILANIGVIAVILTPTTAITQVWVTESSCPDNTPTVFHECALEAAKAFDPPRTSDGQPDMGGIWQLPGAAFEDLEEHPEALDDSGGPTSIVDGVLISHPVYQSITVSTEIEVVDGHVIPEFGTIAAMILVVAIVAIIAVSAKTKLSLVPKY